MDWGVCMWGSIDVIAIAVLGGAFVCGAYARGNPPAGPAMERPSRNAARNLYHSRDDMGNKPLTG